MIKATTWHHVAAVYGYNELVKASKTLAEKVYFRMARDQAEEWAAEAGVKIARGDQGATVLELTTAPPFITFHERDIELMREVVAMFDARTAAATPAAAQGAFDRALAGASEALMHMGTGELNSPPLVREGPRSYPAAAQGVVDFWEYDARVRAAQGALPPLDTYLMRRQGDLAAKGVVESLDEAEAKELAAIRRLLDQAMASVAAQGALATPGEHEPSCVSFVGERCDCAPATPAAQRPIRQEDDEDAYFDAIGELVERAPIPSTSPAAHRRPAREALRAIAEKVRNETTCVCKSKLAGIAASLGVECWYCQAAAALEADRRGEP